MQYTIPADVEIPLEVIRQLESLCDTPLQVQDNINNIVEWAYDMAYGAYGREEEAPGSKQ